MAYNSVISKEKNNKRVDRANNIVWQPQYVIILLFLRMFAVLDNNGK